MNVLCPHCKIPTTHTTVAAYSTGSAPQDEYSWSCNFQVVKCGGCQTVSFREEHWDEDTFDEDEQPQPYEVLYPARSIGRASVFSDWDEIPHKIKRIYDEVILSFNNSMFILAGIGLRAIIEAICKEQNTQGKDLKERIDSLHSLGVLGKQQASILHTHRFLGNLAAHEVEAAPHGELMAALTIAESLMTTIYVLPKLAASIKTGKQP